jgi:hypothetical protein
LEERLKKEREQKEQDELIGCTFAPKTNKTTSKQFEQISSRYLAITNELISNPSKRPEEARQTGEWEDRQRGVRTLFHRQKQQHEVNKEEEESHNCTFSPQINRISKQRATKIGINNEPKSMLHEYLSQPTPSSPLRN